MTQINTLYVASLNYRTNEIDFKTHFEQVGRVKGVEIVKDERGRSLGFGYVEYERPQDAEFAVTQFDGTQFDGKRIHVEFCKSNLKWNLERKQKEKRALLKYREKEDMKREKSRRKERRSHHHHHHSDSDSSSDEKITTKEEENKNVTDKTDESFDSGNKTLLKISGPLTQEFIADEKKEPKKSHRQKHHRHHRHSHRH